MRYPNPSTFKHVRELLSIRFAHFNLMLETKQHSLDGAITGFPEKYKYISLHRIMPSENASAKTLEHLIRLRNPFLYHYFGGLRNYFLSRERIQKCCFDEAPDTLCITFVGIGFFPQYNGVAVICCCRHRFCAITEVHQDRGGLMFVGHTRVK